MGKCLKASPMELDAIFALSAAIPESKITDGRKYSNFRRAIKIALVPYNKGIQEFLDVIREDYKGLDEKKKAKEVALEGAKKEEKKVLDKEIADLNKAMVDIQKEANDRVLKYQEDNKGNVEVTFNEEDFAYMNNLFSTSSNELFKVTLKEGTVYDANRADAFFELLDRIV